MVIFIQRMLSPLVLATFLSTVVAGQDNKPGTGSCFEANVFTGKVIKHTSKFHLPIPELSTGIDINIARQTYGRKDWEQRRRYPFIGIGITYTNYGIDSVYGRCIGIYPNITLPLIRTKKLEWTIRIGNGIGYVTKRYGRHPITDTINNAIGSHINDYFSFNTDIRYHINKHWDVQAGINFTHISDASYHQPNLGINLLGQHIGVRYYPVSRTPAYIHKDLKPLSRRWLLEARGAMAFTQSDAPYGPLFPVYMASVYGSKRWISKNKAFAGIDYSYHEGTAAFLKNNEILPGKEANNSYKSSVFIGNEFLMGRVGVMLQLGFYLKQTYLKQDIYYQKIGGNFYLVQKEKGFIKEFFITGLLKTHKSVAELAEFGIGLGI
ncbi:MAG: acyloxyacyl hydrolase [Taibaiella sp.]|nr:acyloxyacyl hydrolase [Taibaiella sp.]